MATIVVTWWIVAILDSEYFLLKESTNIQAVGNNTNTCIISILIAIGLLANCLLFSKRAIRWIPYRTFDVEAFVANTIVERITGM